MIKMAFVFEIPLTASKDMAGANKTIPMYSIICNEYAIDVQTLEAFPNLFSKY